MSQRIPTSFIQEVLARNDIVEIIRSRVSLTQRGDNHLARCPFHEEKTPSFNVSHSKQFYYCFGCSASGNAIGFLIAFDHMEFREAVTHLAARAGLEVPSSPESDNSEQYQILYQALDNAAQYYRETLRNNTAAIHYLKSRGLSGMTAKNFGIGYAPAGWESVQNAVGNSPELQAALVASGLVINKDAEHTYDRFRDRIMFPIRNIQGQIIGFGGRTFSDAQPKYLNSPETPLFHKGSELYGLHEARQHSAKLAQLVVVEGYMDVIALHQHGITQAVATLGTAVTAKQVQKCLRYVNHLIFCFDGDRAGRQAAWKALTIALPLLRDGIHIRFLFLPESEDPDSLVRKIGAAAFAQQLEQALPLPEVFFRELKNQTPLNSPADKAHLGQQAAQYLNTMPHGLFRQLMYEQLASELQTDAATLNTLLQPPAPQPAHSSNPPKLPLGQRRTQHLLMPPTHQAISLLLKHPLLIEFIPAGEFNGAQQNDQAILRKIILAVREQPTITIGELLAQMDNTEEQQLIAKLAAREFAISPEEMKAELLGALANIRQQSESQEIQALVEKAKKSQLNFEEKGKLQTLLAKLKRDASER
jgi:DNA primase